jgi:hypothetical protein
VPSNDVTPTEKNKKSGGRTRTNVSRSKQKEKETEESIEWKRFLHHMCAIHSLLAAVFFRRLLVFLSYTVNMCCKQSSCE